VPVQRLHDSNVPAVQRADQRPMLQIALGFAATPSCCAPWLWKAFLLAEGDYAPQGLIFGKVPPRFLA
jgi:hypothetical protein